MSTAAKIRPRTSASRLSACGFAHREHPGMRQRRGRGRQSEPRGGHAPGPDHVRLRRPAPPAFRASNGLPVISSHARIDERTIQLLGSVWEPGMARIMSQPRSGPPAGGADILDRRGELAAHVGRIDPRRGAQIEKYLAGLGDEGRLVGPARADAADRALRAQRARGVGRGVFLEPPLQPFDYLGRGEYRVLVGNHMARAGIAQQAMNRHLEPAQPDLFPGHRAGLDDDRVIGPVALFEQEGAGQRRGRSGGGRRRRGRARWSACRRRRARRGGRRAAARRPAPGKPRPSRRPRRAPWGCGRRRRSERRRRVGRGGSGPRASAGPGNRRPRAARPRTRCRSGA